MKCYRRTLSTFYRVESLFDPRVVICYTSSPYILFLIFFVPKMETLVQKTITLALLEPKLAFRRFNAILAGDTGIKRVRGVSKLLYT